MFRKRLQCSTCSACLVHSRCTQTSCALCVAEPLIYPVKALDRVYMCVCYVTGHTLVDQLHFHVIFIYFSLPFLFYAKLFTIVFAHSTVNIKPFVIAFALFAFFVFFRILYSTVHSLGLIAFHLIGQL